MSQPGLRTFQKVFGNFYLAHNEWYVIDYAQQGHGVTDALQFSTRGAVAMLIVRQSYLDTMRVPANRPFVGSCIETTDSTVRIGQAVGIVAIGSLDENIAINCPMGIVEDDLRTGPKNDKATGQWILVQTYGYHDEIYGAGGGDVSSQECQTYLKTTAASGLVVGIRNDVIGGDASIGGAVIIDTSLASCTLLLDGTNATGTTWVAPPSVPSFGNIGRDSSTHAPLSGNPQRPQANEMILGMNLPGTQRTRACDLHLVGGGFIMMMGTNVGRI